jgi:hypothetical protein
MCYTSCSNVLHKLQQCATQATAMCYTSYSYVLHKLQLCATQATVCATQATAICYTSYSMCYTSYSMCYTSYSYSRNLLHHTETEGSSQQLFVPVQSQINPIHIITQYFYNIDLIVLYLLLFWKQLTACSNKYWEVNIILRRKLSSRNCNTQIVGSNPTGDMDVCVCVGSCLVTGRSPV